MPNLMNWTIMIKSVNIWTYKSQTCIHIYFRRNDLGVPVTCCQSLPALVMRSHDAVNYMWGRQCHLQACKWPLPGSWHKPCHQTSEDDICPGLPLLWKRPPQLVHGPFTIAVEPYESNKYSPVALPWAHPGHPHWLLLFNIKAIVLLSFRE